MSLAEVAKIAGVSTTTVSRALNNSPLVRKETASHVRKVVTQIGYIPASPKAKSSLRRVRSGRQAVKSRRIAIISIGQMHTGLMATPVIGSFVSGVIAAARELDVDVMLDDMPRPDQSSRLTRRGDIGGAILLIDSTATSGPDWVRAIKNLARKLPVVWAMGGHAHCMPVDHILPDNLGIGRIAASYLSDCGCLRAAMVTSTPHWSLTRQRLMMFASTAIDSGMKVATYLVSDDPNDGKTYAGSVKVLSTMNDVACSIAGDGFEPDGLFCPRDYETAQLYPVFQKVGMRLMRDIRVISCDNDVTQMSLLSPRPATIDTNPSEVARIAIRRLRSRMRNRNEAPAIINVPPTLIEPTAIAAGPS